MIASLDIFRKKVQTESIKSTLKETLVILTINNGELSTSEKAKRKQSVDRGYYMPKVLRNQKTPCLKPKEGSKSRFDYKRQMQKVDLVQNKK